MPKVMVQRHMTWASIAVTWHKQALPWWQQITGFTTLRAAPCKYRLWPCKISQVAYYRIRPILRSAYWAQYSFSCTIIRGDGEFAKYGRVFSRDKVFDRRDDLFEQLEEILGCSRWSLRETQSSLFAVRVTLHVRMTPSIARLQQKAWTRGKTNSSGRCMRELWKERKWSSKTLDKVDWERTPKERWVWQVSTRRGGCYQMVFIAGLGILWYERLVLHTPNRIYSLISFPLSLWQGFQVQSELSWLSSHSGSDRDSEVVVVWDES